MADFFEKVKQEINKGVATVSTKSKEMLDSSRIKGQIDALTRQKKDGLEELGNIVFTLFLKGISDEGRVRSQCEALASLTDQIREKEEELRKVRTKADDPLGKQMPVGVCLCGSPIFGETRFCGKCGRKVGLSAPERCPGCASPLSADARFCTNCGRKVE